MATRFNNIGGRAPTVQEFGGGFNSAQEFSDKFSGFRSNASRLGLLGAGISPSTAQEIGFFNRNTGRRLGALGSAADELDPRNNAALVRYFEQQARGGIDAVGRGNFNRFKGLFGGGRSPIGRGSFMLQAANQANRQTGQFRQQINDPFNRANRFLGVNQALGSQNVFQGLDQNLRIAGMSGPDRQSPTLLSQGIGLLGAFGSAGGKIRF